MTLLSTGGHCAHRILGTTLIGLVAMAAAACSGNVVLDLPPYHDEKIQPVFDARCTSSPDTPCHVDDGSGRAPGNLALTSFEDTTRRRDVLRRYGSYPMPLLLLKAVADPPNVSIISNGGNGVELPRNEPATA